MATQTGDGSEEERTSGIAHALADVGLYAPIGFALEFRRLIPELADIGRRQVRFSRSLGQTALRTVARSARGAGPRTRSGAARQPGDSAGDSATGQVEGYDDMSAKAIIELARTATAAEVDWMLARERGGKARKTVLAGLAKACQGR